MENVEKKQEIITMTTRWKLALIYSCSKGKSRISEARESSTRDKYKRNRDSG